jgi:Rieske Fe-S protein
MNTPNSSGGRRTFILLVAGFFSAFFFGEKALAAKKPAAKKVVKTPVKKAPVKKAPAKVTPKNTPSPSATPTPSASPSPTPSATPTPSPTASPSASPTPSPTIAAPPADAKALTVAGRNLTTADLAVGATTAATFPKNGATTGVLVTRLDSSTFIALKPICTHAGGPVELSGGSLVCIWHNSRFNQRTGAVINGPATDSLRKENVALFGDTVYYIP